MPASRIYSVSPNGPGQDYSTQIAALNESVENLQEQITENQESLQDQITELSNAGGALFGEKKVTLTGPITSNFEITLDHTPKANSIEVEITTGPELYSGVDFNLVGNKVTLLSSSTVVGVLSANDVIIITYSY